MLHLNARNHTHPGETVTMFIDHCVHCNGTDLYRLQMYSMGRVALKKSTFGMFPVPVDASVCLTAASSLRTYRVGDSRRSGSGKMTTTVAIRKRRN